MREVVYMYSQYSVSQKNTHARQHHYFLYGCDNGPFGVEHDTVLLFIIAEHYLPHKRARKTTLS